MPPRPSTHTRLIALIDESWPMAPAVSWVLIDAHGEVRDRGRSAVTDWPTHDGLWVVLGASQCSWHSVRLPRGRASSDPKLLGFALEDCLLGEPDTHHVTIVRRQAESDSVSGVSAQIIITSRKRLHDIVSLLAASGQHPKHIYSELQCASESAGHWILALRSGHALLQSVTGARVALDGATVQLATLLHDWMSTTATQDDAPTKLTILAEPDARDTADSIAAGLPSSIQIAHGPYSWWATETAADLLHGEFAHASGSGSLLRRLRLPLSITAAALVVLAGGALADILRMRAAVALIEADVRARFSAAMPATPMLAPEAQLARRLETLKQARGQIAGDDLLLQLSEFAALQADTPITALRYDAGTLSLTLESEPAATLPDLQRALDERGARNIELILGKTQ